MAQYRIKKYFIKKLTKKKYIICATVYKYRFGFLVDIYDEDLDDKLKCDHEHSGFRFLEFQHPKSKKQALTELSILRNLKS